MRYGETDKMGVVYYGNYAQYLEIARTEMFRDIGITYRQLEDRGIIMPVVSMMIKYIQPLTYDEEFIIETSVPEFPGVKIDFLYHILNAQDIVCTKAETRLIFMNKDGKPVKAPEDIMEILKQYY